MADQHSAFSGSIPATYDEFLGPMFFEPYATDLAGRFKSLGAENVLEIAAGTGIVTRHLARVMRRRAHLTATDLNDAMLDLAKARVGSNDRIEWRVADATALPFEAAQFDAVVCQFGLMFFPDKGGALGEMRRVLKPGGTVLLNTWGPLRDNPIAHAAHEEISNFFHTDPPPFYTVPFGLHDVNAVADMFRKAGFASVEWDTVNVTGESATALAAARGLVCGTPVLSQIQERGMADATAVVHAVAGRLAAAGGSEPMRLPMRALVFTAR